MDNALQEALFQSLVHSPLLCTRIGTVPAFDQGRLRPAQDDFSQLTAPNLDQKLGHLYEDALKELLRHSDQVELIADHVQIFNSNQRTLGELDFLIHNRTTNQTVHLELAIKFYLAIQVDGHWQYPGPDPRDNWPRKLARLQSHQLPLIDRPETQAKLSRTWDIYQVRSQHLIHGMIFRPLEHPNAPLPTTVNPSCRTGDWIYLKDWDRHFKDVASVKWVPKPFWPIQLPVASDCLLPEAPINILYAKASQRGILIQNPSSGRPCFVMPDTWMPPADTAQSN